MIGGPRDRWAWLREDAFRNLLKNAGWLLGSNVLAAVAAFATTMIAAQDLGPDDFGRLALVIAYGTVVGVLVSFQAWQAFIKFGQEAIEADDSRALGRLATVGFSLDAFSALLGTALAFGLAGTVISWLGWDPSLRRELWIYSSLVLFQWRGTPTGILRLFDRFDLLGRYVVIEAALRLVGVILCVFFVAGLRGYVVAHVVSGVVAHAFLVCEGVRILRRSGHRFARVGSEDLRAMRRQGVADYVWTTNLNSTIRMLSRELDVIVVAALTGPAAVAMYKIAKQVGVAVGRLVDPLYQSVYPELTRLRAQGRRAEFVRMMRRTSALGVGAVSVGLVIFWLAGAWMIRLAFGSQYDAAFGPTLVYLVAQSISIVTFSFQPAMLALGRPRKSFVILVLSTSAYFAVLYPLTIQAGPTGAAWAYVVYYVAWAGLMIHGLTRAFRADDASASKEVSAT